jgi:predicted RNase H-like nuclease
MTAEKAAERQAARDNLVRELCEALEGVIGWVPGRHAFHTDAAEKAVERARNVLTRVRYQQGE